jgi:type II secretory pathway pseudopilin PulG
LAELLIALVFMGVCTGVLLDATTSAYTRSALARDRIIALSLAEGALDDLRSRIISREFSVGNSTTPLLSTGINGTVNQTTNVQLVPGHSLLYSVTVTISWTHVTGNQRSGSITLQTMMVNPDA